MTEIKIESFPWDDPEAVKNQIEELELENSMLYHEVKRINNIAHKRLLANNATFAWGVFFGVLFTMCSLLLFLQFLGVKP